MYTYYSRKHDAHVRECPVCKHKYGKSYSNESNRYPWGKADFMYVTDFHGITYKAEGDWKQTTSDLWICPKCGTMGVGIEVYDRYEE